LAEAHAVLAYVYRTQDWNWAGAAAELHLALSADPSDPVSLMFDGLLAIALGQLDKADRQLRAAVFRDPPFNYANFNLGQVLYLQGRYGDAEIAWRTLLEISPGFKWTRPFLAKTLPAQGRSGHRPSKRTGQGGRAPGGEISYQNLNVMHATGSESCPCCLT